MSDLADYLNERAQELENLARIRELLGEGVAKPKGLISDTILAVVEKLVRLERRLENLEVAKRHPNWMDMPR